MAYNPREDTIKILDEAYSWVQSVKYSVTARWVFYRLLQNIAYLKRKGEIELAAVKTKEELKAWRAKHYGKKSELNQILKAVGKSLKEVNRD